MARRPILGLSLAALFGLSLILPCLAMGDQDEVPMRPMTGCASDQAPSADLVCASSFKPAPSHEGLQPISLAVVKNPPVVLSTEEGLEAPAVPPTAREHARPAYLLHNAFLI